MEIGIECPRCKTIFQVKVGESSVVCPGCTRTFKVKVLTILEEETKEEVKIG